MPTKDAATEPMIEVTPIGKNSFTLGKKIYGPGQTFSCPKSKALAYIKRGSAVAADPSDPSLVGENLSAAQQRHESLTRPAIKNPEKQ